MTVTGPLNLETCKKTRPHKTGISRLQSRPVNNWSRPVLTGEKLIYVAMKLFEPVFSPISIYVFHLYYDSSCLCKNYVYFITFYSTFSYFVNLCWPLVGCVGSSLTFVCLGWPAFAWVELP